MAFILNRRAKLRASAIPVEIPDPSKLVQKTDKATASKLGLVKIGDNVNISSGGAISVPVGSAETAGVYKVGEGLSVADGVLSATGGGVELTKILDANYPDYLGGTKNLSASYVDAKLMIFVTTKSGIATSSIAVLPVTGGKYSFTGGGAVITATLSVSDDVYKVTFNASGSPTDENIKIYII